MRTYELGDVIAERPFVLRRNEGPDLDVTVRVGRPVLDDPRAEYSPWVCPFQIVGVRADRVMGIFGVDSMQALLLALHTIPVELATYARQIDAEVLSDGEQDRSFLAGCRIALEFAGRAFPAASEHALDPDLTNEQQERVLRLTPSEVAQIDASLLSQASTHWRKVARIVGASLLELENILPDLPDIYLAQRVAELVHAGKLESQGALRTMRFSEVRIPRTSPPPLLGGEDPSR